LHDGQFENPDISTKIRLFHINVFTKQISMIQSPIMIYFNRVKTEWTHDGLRSLSIPFNFEMDLFRIWDGLCSFFHQNLKGHS